MIDAATLSRLRELEAKATKGPWSDEHPVYDGKFGVTGVFLCGDELQQISGSGGARSFTPTVCERVGTDKDKENFAFIAALRNAAPALFSAAEENARLRDALAKARAWHESEDKALSKSGRGDADYYWRRGQHREQIDEIKLVQSDADYNAAWDAMNERARALLAELEWKKDD